MRFRLQLTSFFLLLFSFANAQIKLSGKVVNSKNEPVAGVSVKIVGATGGTTTDVEGRYSLNLSTGKKYELEFSTIGYATKLVNDIEVGSGLDNELNIVLEVAAKDIEGVVVKATSRRQESTAALLSFQKNNIALSSGLASDFIRRTPDKNTGEVLKRVSGTSIQDGKFVIVRGLSDRYNTALINNAQLPSSEPDKKAFSFDIFPAVLVDNIIINKTATPDLPGEFAGGIVQVNTKDVPSKDVLSVGVSFGFNTQSAFKDFTSNKRNGTDWLGFDDNTRKLPTGFPATAQEYRNLGIQQQIEASRLLKNDVYREKNSTAIPIQTYSLTFGKSKRFKNNGVLGTIFSVQYRVSQLKYEVQRNLYLNNGDPFIDLNDNQNKYGVNAGAIGNITYIKGRHKISFKNLFNQLFEDNYYSRTGVSLDRSQDINFRSSVLNQRLLYSGQLEGEHQITNSGIKLKWNGNFSYNWKSQPDLRTSSYFRSTGSSDPFEYNDDDTRRFFSDLKDYSYGANGFVSIPFSLNQNKQLFKIGGSTLIRIRDFRSRLFQYEPASPLLFDPAKESLPYDVIFAPENIGLDGFVINETTNNVDKYFGVSALNGMYGMFDNKLGDKVRLVWGVRVENFHQVLTTKDVTSKRLVTDNEKWDVLPSINFTFSPTVKHNIRFAASRTVARPEFREIAPFSFYDYEANYAVNGNLDLKRTSILNGDIRYEFYPKGGEAITIGAFYKQFDDPIELTLDPSSVVDRRNYGFVNADKATTFGVELEARKALDFMSANLENFSVFTNLTYIYSKVTLPGDVSINRPLQGQSPYLVNLGLQYNSQGGDWSGSVLYNRVGQRVALVGNTEYADIYERPRDQVDFQLAKRILSKRGELKFTVADLLNNEYYFYENIDSKKAFKDGTDRRFSSYKPGVTLTIGFTYDFNIASKNKK